ncbi:class I SAM-dependent methyltransferase [Novispirillum itersonii]|uniref:tRNA (Cmo5U34)-methyltransferase n=1 Tax=Novispirillum itersonii TaxID=189 RepID=A0A7W9ZGJ2_NOVIT|nr:class I SAM-dependent methyltransferase [Novispirillum itersonii]MBB6209879.1 tRNA (cmo5U34)-methyltransferase [Novispirillum itersonii]
MTTEMTQPRRETFHADRARRYDDTIRRVLPGYDTLHALSAVMLETAGAGDAARVLVTGAGTGTELELMARRNPGWHLVACDPAEGMLAVAQARLEEAGLDRQVSLHVGITDSLPPQDLFDAAACLLVLHFLPDDGTKLALLHSVARRLRPGAPLVIADMAEDPASPRFRHLLAAWTRWQAEAGIDPQEIEKGLRHIERDIHFIPETRFAALLGEAGFTPPERYFGGLLFTGSLCHRTQDL